FDGALTVLGIIIGAVGAGATEAHKPLILSASVGAAVALAVSSAVGAYEAERVEKKLDITTIERALLARLSEEHKEAFQFAAIVVALVILFIIGSYLGNLVRERVVVTGLRFVAAGLGTAVVLWLMGTRPI